MHTGDVRAEQRRPDGDGRNCRHPREHFARRSPDDAKKQDAHEDAHDVRGVRDPRNAVRVSDRDTDEHCGQRRQEQPEVLARGGHRHLLPSSRTNANDRLPRASLGRVERGEGVKTVKLFVDHVATSTAAKTLDFPARGMEIGEVGTAVGFRERDHRRGPVLRPALSDSEIAQL
jgi:hypothetical protein